jgi:hypothetical protein
MWIDFQNLQIGVNIRIEYAQLYENCWNTNR